MTPQFIEAVAILACTLFTGAAVYITAVEHPARLSCGVEAAVAQWAPSYKRATVMQVPLALIAGLFGILRGTQGGGPLWLWASVLILTVIPFTLLVIRPTNNRLLDPHRDRRSDEIHRLLKVWGRLHAVRGGLSIAASYAIRLGGHTLRRFRSLGDAVAAFGRDSMAAITLDFENQPQLRFRIDNFSVPASARAEFQAAMQRNFAFIQTLPGFQRHLVFEKASGPSTFNVVTVAVWESPEAIEKAIVAVRDYYEKIGFNPASATAEWGVTSEVGQYYVLADGNTPVPWPQRARIMSQEATAAARTRGERCCRSVSWRRSDRR